MKTIEEVQNFWEKNPLWTGESKNLVGSREFFQEHRSVCIEDCFGGSFDIRFMPPPRPNGQKMKLLDLGCGIGFWVSEFGLRGFNNLFAADLTQQALILTQKRLDALGVQAILSQQNAESLTFTNESFDHVNCQGVIHHTPNTEAAIAEIARVLKPGGTASISVYYRNPILRLWPLLRLFAWPLAKLGGGLIGRGREKIFLESDIDEIVRLYDGSDNPLGKSYTEKQFRNLLDKHFIVTETYLHFFPARALPFKIPKSTHKWLDKTFGFLLYASLQKPSNTYN
jgi:ubiquinone/menaquinone biosynthesis C-methylase UbiE